MANAIRSISLDRGLDPRRFSLLPFGGAGPVHACAIADILEIGSVVVPPWPGVFSAVGCILAGIRFDDTWSILKRVDQVTPDEIAEVFARMADRVFGVLEAEGVTRGEVTLIHEAALQYEGQTHRLTVRLPSADTPPEAMHELFESGYRKTFFVSVEGLPVRLVNLRLRAVVERDKPLDLRVPVPESGGIDAALAGTSRMRFAGTWYDAPVYDRWRIPRDAVAAGPARIDQSDTTIVVPPGWTAAVDVIGNLELTRGGKADA